jgi:hypothetical protein
MEYTNTAQWEKKCYESHKPLPVGQYLIYGGSASWPVVKDADVYVSLQDGSTCGFVSDPWDQAQVIEVNHYIPDGKVPVDAVRFRKLVEWVCNQLQSGKKVHVGCIGGHGRTGLLLAAVVAHLTGEKDAIAYVRKHYCPRAVESSAQVKFLGEHFGVLPASGYKENLFVPAKKGSSNHPLYDGMGKLGYDGAGKAGYNHYASGSIRPADKPKQPTSLFLPIYEKVSNAQVPAPATTGLVLTPIQSKRNLWRK